MKISVVIPTYNEEKRIGKRLDEMISYFNKKKMQNEIIIVDDGSTDKTRDIVKEYKHVKITEKRKNKGKGYSVKQGMLIANGDYLLFTDADQSTGINELDKFMKLIKKYDIVIGSRALRGSKVTNKWHKAFLGKTGNLFVRLFAVNGIKDTQCGFKLFRNNAAKEIFKKQTINRWGFDFELLHIAQKKGFLIKEQPVKWIRDKQSKVNLLDYPKTLLELLKIKVNDLNGVYD